MIAKCLLAENISVGSFKKLLNEYSGLADSISSSKGSNTGQKTLLELDKFRYDDATKLFSSQKPKRTMNHEDVKSLIDWKLRHGKFRPTLMKLISFNDEVVVKDTIEKVMGGYWSKPDVSKALDGITKLKGIGPATASLLLSVHDPERVIFFSDEAFYWLCCQGEKSPIKYNTKEYSELNTATQALVQRLQVSATDVEKVAYVIMKQDVPSPSVYYEGEAPSSKKPAEGYPVKFTAKRKNKLEDKALSSQPVRRSKRVKAS